MNKTLSLRIPKELYEKLQKIVTQRRYEAIKNNRNERDVTLSNIIRTELFLPFVIEELSNEH